MNGTDAEIIENLQYVLDREKKAHAATLKREAKLEAQIVAIRDSIQMDVIEGIDPKSQHWRIDVLVSRQEIYQIGNIDMLAGHLASNLASKILVAAKEEAKKRADEVKAKLKLAKAINYERPQDADTIIQGFLDTEKPRL